MDFTGDYCAISLQDVIARVGGRDDRDIVALGVGAVPSEVDRLALKGRSRQERSSCWGARKRRYLGDGRGVNGEVGESSLDGERGEESDGNEGGVHRESTWKEWSRELRRVKREATRGGEAGARMREEKQDAKKREAGLAPRVSLVTRQPARPQTRPNTAPAASPDRLIRLPSSACSTSPATASSSPRSMPSAIVPSRAPHPR